MPDEFSSARDEDGPNTGQDTDEELHLEAAMQAISNPGGTEDAQPLDTTALLLDWLGCWAQSES